MVEREAAGDFDYLFDDPADDGGATRHDQAVEPSGAGEFGHLQTDPDDDMWDEPDDSFWDNQPDPEDTGHFDAFNTESWSFTPPPTAWYRTRAATTAIVAASAAMAAIVVSGVLLVFRGSSAGTINEVTSSVTPTAPTSAPVEVASSQPLPPPAPPPPPPPPAVASPETGAPRSSSTNDTHPSKSPSTAVAPTPITRLPLSVAPQQHTPHNGFR